MLTSRIVRNLLCLYRSSASGRRHCIGQLQQQVHMLQPEIPRCVLGETLPKAATAMKGVVQSPPEKSWEMIPRPSMIPIRGLILSTFRSYPVAIDATQNTLALTLVLPIFSSLEYSTLVRSTKKSQSSRVETGGLRVSFCFFPKVGLTYFIYHHPP